MNNALAILLAAGGAAPGYSEYNLSGGVLNTRGGVGLFSPALFRQTGGIHTNTESVSVDGAFPYWGGQNAV